MYISEIKNNKIRKEAIFETYLYKKFYKIPISRSDILNTNLYRAFGFSDSKHGYTYWDDIYMRNTSAVKKQIFAKILNKKPKRYGKQYKRRSYQKS